MCDCIILPYNNFKEKIKVQKELEQIMIKELGKKARQYYQVITLENCIFAQFKSKNLFH